SYCVGQLVTVAPSKTAWGQAPARRLTPAGRGAWMIPFLGQWALQLVENQLAVLLEYAQRRFERMGHRLSNLQGVANITRVLAGFPLENHFPPHYAHFTVIFALIL